jgi:hypothetical protein
MKGLLVRVGIDSTDGRWNAPVDSRTGAFAYVTITETKPIRSGLARLYDEFQPALSPFGLTLPAHLVGLNTHLDPDFLTLTYGDQGSRANQLRGLGENDLIVFFAGMRDVCNPTRELVYAIIGFYVISEIVAANSIEKSRWSENAHTRRIPGATDLVVRAQPGVSGRLEKCIPIGEYRQRAYRIKRDLVVRWGGLTVKNGYAQRSARLPEFRQPNRFYDWFLAQEARLLRINN